MRKSTKELFGLLIVSMLLGLACATTLKIPAAEQVDYITVSKVKNSQMGKSHQIKDEGVISQLHLFIEKRNDNWVTPGSYTFPTPQKQATFYGTRAQVLFVLWFGADWVGGRSHINGMSDNYIWRLGSDDRRKLLNLLDL